MPAPSRRSNFSLDIARLLAAARTSSTNRYRVSGKTGPNVLNSKLWHYHWMAEYKYRTIRESWWYTFAHIFDARKQKKSNCDSRRLHVRIAFCPAHKLRQQRCYCTFVIILSYKRLWFLVLSDHHVYMVLCLLTYWLTYQLTEWATCLPPSLIWCTSANNVHSAHY